jgi:hypothetical protein
MMYFRNSLAIINYQGAKALPGVSKGTKTTRKYLKNRAPSPTISFEPKHLL